MSYKYLPGMLTRREREIVKLIKQDRYTAKLTKMFVYSLVMTPPRGSTLKPVRVRTTTLDRLVQSGHLVRRTYYTEKYHIPFWIYESKR